jgi:hypothetical protein
MKSNEKLTAKGMESIEFFLTNLGELSLNSPAPFKIKVMETFRRIINGGKNPSDLKVRNNPNMYTIQEDTCSRVIDLDYMFDRIKKSYAIRHIVTEFVQVAKALNYHNANVITPSKSKDPSKMTREEELAFYGLPIESTTSDDPNTDEPTSPAGNKKAEDFPEIMPLEQESKAVMRELTQILLDICLDLTNNFEIACLLCEYRILDGVIVLLQKDFHHDQRDHRISYIVELLWNVLEPFTEKIRTSLQAPALEILDAESIQPVDATASPAVSTPQITVTDILLQYEEQQEVPFIDLEKAIPILHEIFLFQLMDGFRELDKELRNELLIVLTLLAEFPYAVGYFLHSHMFHLFVTYACVEEVGHANWPFFNKKIANSRNFATISDTDLEFKKQLWNIINILLQTNDPDAILCVAASPLIPSMIDYLEYEIPSNNGLSATQTQVPATPGSATGSINKQEISSILIETMQQSSVFSESPSVFPATPSHNKSAVSENNSPQQPQHQISMSSKSKQPSVTLKPFSGPGGAILSKPPTATGANRPSVTNNTMTISVPGATMNTTAATKTSPLKKKAFLTQLTPSKLKEFQLQSSLFLVQNIPKLLSEFQRIQGLPRVLTLLMKYILSEAFEHRQLIFYLLILINKCMLTCTEITEYLENNSGIAICLYLFIHCTDKEEDIRGCLVRIIALLCANQNTFCQYQFATLQSMPVLLPVLRMYITKRPALIGLKAGIKIMKHLDVNDPYSDPTENPYSGDVSVLIIAILHCFQNCIIGNVDNELQFVELEGLDILLDLLEISPFVLRIHVLRLLSNLLKNTEILGFFYNWRSSKSFRSAGQMICHAWLDEEVRLRGERQKDHGIIANVFDPLGNHNWAVAPFEVPLVGMFAATTGEEILSQSVTVNKLATAILAGRNAIQTNLPVHICTKVLESDVRVILSDILHSVGLYSAYHIHDEHNPCKVNEHKALSVIEEMDENIPLDSPDLHMLSSSKKGNNNNNNNNNNRSPNGSSKANTRNNTANSANNSRGKSQSPTRRANHSFTAENATSIASGFDDGKLLPRELQVLSLAKKYYALREGDWWRKVQQHVKAQGIIPIESDAALLDTRLEYSFDAALATQLEQMQLFEDEEQLKKDDESTFIDGILTKMHQQIKAEWSKKMARGGGPKKTTLKQAQAQATGAR